MVHKVAALSVHQATGTAHSARSGPLGPRDSSSRPSVAMAVGSLARPTNSACVQGRPASPASSG